MSEYEEALQELVESTMTTQLQFQRVYDLGKQEDKSDEEIRADIIDAFKGKLSERTITYYLPEELKSAQHVKSGKKGAESKKKLAATFAANQPKLVHKDSSEVDLPQVKAQIIDAESEPVPRQERLLMEKKILGKLYEIRGKYQGDYDFALIAENGRIIEVEPHPVLKAEALRA